MIVVESHFKSLTHQFSWKFSPPLFLSPHSRKLAKATKLKKIFSSSSFRQLHETIFQLTLIKNLIDKNKLSAISTSWFSHFLTSSIKRSFQSHITMLFSYSIEWYPTLSTYHTDNNIYPPTACLLSNTRDWTK